MAKPTIASLKSQNNSLILLGVPENEFWKRILKAVADPAFPIGGHAPVSGGMDLRRRHFLVKMYAKTKELGPIMGGVRPARPPLDPPMKRVYFFTGQTIFINRKTTGGIVLLNETARILYIPYL